MPRDEALGSKEQLSGARERAMAKARVINAVAARRKLSYISLNVKKKKRGS
jgi:hypothetical protein